MLRIKQNTDVEPVLRRHCQQGDCVFIALKNHRSVLLGLRKYILQDGKTHETWTLPGGRGHADELLGQILDREIREETGITIYKVTTCLGTIAGTYPGDMAYIFAGYSDQLAIITEPEKFEKWQWFDKDSLPQEILNPELREILIDYLA